uniref:BSD domain-containing protein n=1 Tax=Pristionchus pacificus TaxID=54126 RepID=A0A8R1Z9L7_PRIPA
EKDPTSAAASAAASPVAETAPAAAAAAAAGDEAEKEKQDPIEAQLEKITSAGLGFMKSLVDTVKGFGIEDTTQDEDDTTEIIRPHKTLRNSPLSKIRLMELQTSEDTFLVPPEESNDYDVFAEHFSISEHDGEINHLLSTNPPMRSIFSSLVPEKVDNVTFWMRYFYKLDLAEATESKKVIDKEIVPESVKREQPESPAHSQDDWSVCSPGEGEIQEIETDPSTPTPSETTETSPDETEKPTEEKKKEGEEKGDKKDGDWVDWDE